MVSQQSQILIVDFGSQYTQLIARRVRELGVYCEIQPFDVAPAVIEEFEPKGFILSGGPESVVAAFTPRIPDAVFTSGKPILGICYGMQAMAHQLGGVVDSSTHQEFGYASVRNDQSNPLFKHVESKLDVWMSHGDKVLEVPRGFHIAGESDVSPIAAMADPQRSYYGLQFHPEVSHTTCGTELLRTFLVDICSCKQNWRAHHIIDRAVGEIREMVGSDQVILGLSGGVDSSVAAALISRAIGDQLTCVFVDNGLLRKGEKEAVEQTFSRTNALNLNLVSVDARTRFLEALQGVVDPEAKRKVIGKTFVDVFVEEAKKLRGVQWLGQGTIYPDVVESSATKFGKAHVIKSHHNVGGLPERLHLKLLEPLRELFKDEVRVVGDALGLPHELVYRHPFPGPGLSVRVLGEVKEDYLSILREADAIFTEELHRNDWYHKVGQAFAVFLPVKAVGVVGDTRTYDYVIALRAVSTSDFMTADWSPLPNELIGSIANRIMNEVANVSRVVYDVSSKPPATIEWE